MPNLPRVLITRPLPPEAMAFLEGKAETVLGPVNGPLPESFWRDELARADALVPMLSDRVDRAVLERGGRLRIVANYAAGFNNVDLAAADELGVWVTNTPDATTEATAECAFALMLAVARHLPASERFLREGRFEGWRPTTFLGMELCGGTLGIVGMGRIGTAVARRAVAFGMKVLYVGRRPAPEAERLGAERRTLDEVLREADVLSLHCPLTPETRHLIDAAALAKMKRTAIFINTARGPVVDEGALAEALHEGRLAGAGLDVYEEEPRVHPRLLTAPHAVLLSHIGTSTLRTRVAMAEKALGDVLRVLAGGEPRHPVNRPRSPRR